MSEERREKKEIIRQQRILEEKCNCKSGVNDIGEHLEQRLQVKEMMGGWNRS